MSVVEHTSFAGYEVQRILDVNPLGEVCEATPPMNAKRRQTKSLFDGANVVTLRFLSARLQLDEERVNRFLVDMRRARELDHRNIVRVFDINQDNDRHFIVEERLEHAVPLSRILARCRQRGEGLSTAEIGYLVGKVLCALCYAHECETANKMVHHGISLERVLVTPEGEVKMFGFGAERILRVGAGAVAQDKPIVDLWATSELLNSLLRSVAGGPARVPKMVAELREGLRHAGGEGAFASARQALHHLDQWGGYRDTRPELSRRVAALTSSGTGTGTGAGVLLLEAKKPALEVEPAPRPKVPVEPKSASGSPVEAERSLQLTQPFVEEFPPSKARPSPAPAPNVAPTCGGEPQMSGAREADAGTTPHDEVMPSPDAIPPDEGRTMNAAPAPAPGLVSSSSGADARGLLNEVERSKGSGLKSMLAGLLIPIVFFAVFAIYLFAPQGEATRVKLGRWMANDTTLPAADEVLENSEGGGGVEGFWGSFGYKPPLPSTKEKTEPPTDEVSTPAEDAAGRADDQANTKFEQPEFEPPEDKKLEDKKLEDKKLEDKKLEGKNPKAEGSLTKIVFKTFPSLSRITLMKGGKSVCSVTNAVSCPNSVQGQLEVHAYHDSNPVAARVGNGSIHRPAKEGEPEFKEEYPTLDVIGDTCTLTASGVDSQGSYLIEISTCK